MANSELSQDDLLPVLVADLAEEGSRIVLEGVALAGGEVRLPLVTAPIDATTHLLEVHTPESPEPLLLLAEPLGPPDGDGFLLRLTPLNMPSGNVKVGVSPSDPSALRPRTTGNHHLTSGHAAALSGHPAPSHVGRLLANGKLRIEERVGSGGMGVVYRATHLALQMPVAVKVLHPRLQHDLDFAQRFQAEALAASRLDHVNLTRVLDFGQEEDGLVYLAMEFLNGTSLRSVLEQKGRLSMARLVAIATQVCSGLAHMHARGVVHRDMKPDNVILVGGADEDYQPIEVVKLCDFGISVPRGTVAKEIDGTPEYMSPEQCARRELDARSDVYACGVMLYEMAVGRTPFEGEHAAKILERQQRAEPPPPSSVAPVDPRLEALILKALRKNPAERHQGARELRRELLGLVQQDAPVSRPKPPPVPQRPEWLASSTNFLAEVTVSQPRPPTGAVEIPTTANLVGDFTRQPAKWLAAFVATTDPAAFASKCEDLVAVIPAIAQQKDLGLLWRIRSTLAVVADEGRSAYSGRVADAERALKALEEVAVLTPAATDALRGTPPSREARGLVTGAGARGAYALYGVRAKAPPMGELRSRFIGLMREIGPKATPVLRGALANLAQAGAPPPDLVEDLLAAVPQERDDATGEAVARFLRSRSTEVRRAATAALTRSWGDRARALLVGLLQDPDERVRIAAIAGIRASPVDEPIARKLAGVLEGKGRRAVEKREAVQALGDVAPAARPVAVLALQRAIADLAAAESAEEDLLVDVARALVGLAGREGAPAVSARAARSPEPLRGKLRAVLRLP